MQNTYKDQEFLTLQPFNVPNTTELLLTFCFFFFHLQSDEDDLSDSKRQQTHHRRRLSAFQTLFELYEQEEGTSVAAAVLLKQLTDSTCQFENKETNKKGEMDWMYFNPEASSIPSLGKCHFHKFNIKKMISQVLIGI